jgi:hypothetical protein
VRSLWLNRTPQLSQDITAYAGFLRDKAAVLGAVIKGTLPQIKTRALHSHIYSLMPSDATSADLLSA